VPPVGEEGHLPASLRAPETHAKVIFFPTPRSFLTRRSQTATADPEGAAAQSSRLVFALAARALLAGLV
jgi:hypothetical protein